MSLSKCVYTHADAFTINVKIHSCLYKCTYSYANEKKISPLVGWEHFVAVLHEHFVAVIELKLQMRSESEVTFLFSVFKTKCTDPLGVLPAFSLLVFEDFKKSICLMTVTYTCPLTVKVSWIIVIIFVV